MIEILHAGIALSSKRTRSCSRQAKSARHGCRVRHSAPVHTSILLVFHDPGRHRSLDRQTGNKRRRGSHFLWRVRDAPISACGRPRGEQGYEGEKRQTPLNISTLRQGLGWQGLALVRPRRASIVDAAAVNTLEWTLADKLAGGWQRTARGVLNRLVML